MQQRISSEAESKSVNKRFQNIKKPKGSLPNSKELITNPNLREINPVLSLPYCFLKFNFNINLTGTLNYPSKKKSKAIPVTGFGGL
jgi:hypothetical protein